MQHDIINLLHLWKRLTDDRNQIGLVLHFGYQTLNTKTLSQ